MDQYVFSIEYLRGDKVTWEGVPGASIFELIRVTPCFVFPFQQMNTLKLRDVLTSTANHVYSI